MHPATKLRIFGMACIGIASVLAGIAIVNAQTFGTPQQTILAYKYRNITSQTTTVVKSDSGILHTICVNTPVATETITIYDNTAGSGTKIGTVTVFAATNPCLIYDVNFSTGLTIVTATASSDITVSYY